MQTNELGMTSAAVEHLFLSLVTTYQMSSSEFDDAYEAGSRDWAAFKENNTALGREEWNDPGKLLLYLGHSCQETFVE